MGQTDKFNAVSADMLDRLSGLQRLPGSKFSFETVKEEGALRIKTNVPDAGETGTKEIEILIGAEGRVKVDGGDRYVDDMLSVGGYSDRLFSSAKGSAARKAVALVEKKAREQGLIP